MNITKKAYCCINENSLIREKSSSGGIFYLLAEFIINRNGVVFGAKFDDEYRVVHDCCETIQGIEKFMGSKYVQSYIGDSYIQVLDYLKNGRQVLFSGTPCQINGLKAFLGKDYDNLVTVDFICHGVPSPLVWKKYLYEVSNGKEIQDISFRNKENGWLDFSLAIKYGIGERYIKTLREDTYMKGL